VAGKPAREERVNLGRAVVEHLVREGLRSSARGGEDVDVLIAGSGPAGLSCALSCWRTASATRYSKKMS